MSFLISRLFVFAGLVLLSIIVLGVASAAQSTTPTASLGLPIATAIITILTVAVFLTLDRIRDGLVATKIITELIAFALLWILWVSSAGSMTSSTLKAMSPSIPTSTPTTTTTATTSNTRTDSNSTTSPSDYDTGGFCYQSCHPLFQGETDLEKLCHRRESSSVKIPQSVMVPAGRQSMFPDAAGPPGSLYHGYDPAPLPSRRNSIVSHQHTGSGQSLLPIPAGVLQQQTSHWTRPPTLASVFFQFLA